MASPVTGAGGLGYVGGQPPDSGGGRATSAAFRPADLAGGSLLPLATALIVAVLGVIGIRRSAGRHRPTTEATGDTDA